MGNYKYYPSRMNKYFRYKFIIDVIKNQHITLYIKRKIISKHIFYIGLLSKTVYLNDKRLITFKTLPKEKILCTLITCRL